MRYNPKFGHEKSYNERKSAHQICKIINKMIRICLPFYEIAIKKNRKYHYLHTDEKRKNHICLSSELEFYNRMTKSFCVNSKFQSIIITMCGCKPHITINQTGSARKTQTIKRKILS